MEIPRYEAAPRGVTPENAYEQNYAMLLELMGRINGRLATKRRSDVPMRLIRLSVPVSIFVTYPRSLADVTPTLS